MDCASFRYSCKLQSSAGKNPAENHPKRWLYAGIMFAVNDKTYVQLAKQAKRNRFAKAKHNRAQPAKASQTKKFRRKSETKKNCSTGRQSLPKGNAYNTMARAPKTASVT